MADVFVILNSVVVTGATVVLALLTARYVSLTRQMVRSMESTREPFVDMELDFPRHTLRLAFINAGGTAARNIKFRVIHDCTLIETYEGKTGLTGVYPIENGISYLPAGQRLMWEAGNVPANFPVDQDATLEIEVSYTNDEGRQFSRTIRYDLRQINHVLFESFHNTHVTVAQAIRDAARERTTNYSGFFRNFGKVSCPHCQEMIQESARKCRYCHEWIESGTNVDQGDDPALNDGQPGDQPPAFDDEAARTPQQPR